MGNPQTDELLHKLQLEHILTIPWNSTQFSSVNYNDSVTGERYASGDNNKDEAEIDIDDIIEDDELSVKDNKTINVMDKDANEIDINDVDGANHRDEACSETSININNKKQRTYS
jgi:hypothetical protein